MPGFVGAALEFLRTAIIDWRERRDKRAEEKRNKKARAEAVALEVKRQEEWAAAALDRANRRREESKRAADAREKAWRKIADADKRALDSNPYGDDAE